MARIFNYMPYIFYCCISLKNKKVKPLKFNIPIACSKTDCFLHPD